MEEKPTQAGSSKLVEGYYIKIKITFMKSKCHQASEELWESETQATLYLFGTLWQLTLILLYRPNMAPSVNSILFSTISQFKFSPLTQSLIVLILNSWDTSLISFTYQTRCWLSWRWISDSICRECSIVIGWKVKIIQNMWQIMVNGLSTELRV